jgi:hypothetical protein
MVRYVSRKGSHKNFRFMTVGSTMHLTIQIQILQRAECGQGEAHLLDAFR